MDIIWFYKRIKLLLINPSLAWEIIIDENLNYKDIFRKLILPFLVFIFISIFSGTYIFNQNILKAGYSFLIYFFLIIFCIYITSILIFRMVKNFNLVVNINQIYKVISFSLVPFLFSLIFSSFNSSLSFLKLFGLYSIYLLYIGIFKIIEKSEEKRLVLTISASFIFIVLFFSAEWLLMNIYEKY